MNPGALRQTLDTGVAAMLAWEQRKRREKTLLAALAAALLAALALPLFVTLAPPWTWSTPIAAFALIAPTLLYAWRWRGGDTVRALAALDKALGSGERMTTAWELTRRNDARAVALLVLREASERLQGAKFRKLFPRRWTKQDLLVLPLLALWLALSWFETRVGHSSAAPQVSASVARELRDFARDLEETARAQGLPQTTEAARELARLAQRGIDAQTPDPAFQREIAEAQKQIATQASASAQDASGSAASQRQLDELKAELQSARDWLAAAGNASRNWDEVLGRLSELRQHGEWRQDQGGKTLTRDQVDAFLDKLDKRVTAELDRRALRQTERRLGQLARGEQGEEGGTHPGAGGAGEKDETLAQVPEGQPSAPGEKPGTAAGKAAPLPQFSVGEQSAVKGTLGEGASSNVLLKGQPTPGKSAVAADPVFAAYHRRAEAELNNERIPGELKGAIRSYFLSLEASK
ncbi:MAG: hypothetical protein FJY56_04775 [Betaproteobacteria bacterium]|nr:hypothetical protein [Betaproteobacteria bacterium]